MRSPTAGPARARLACAAVGILLAAGLAAFRAWYDQRPPPAEGPAVVRVVYADRLLPPPYWTARLPDGSRLALQLSGIDGPDRRPIAHLIVTPARAQPASLDLPEGAAARVRGVRIEVVRIWRTPNPSNEAVDVLIRPAP